MVDLWYTYVYRHQASYVVRDAQSVRVFSFTLLDHHNTDIWVYKYASMILLTLHTIINLPNHNVTAHHILDYHVIKTRALELSQKSCSHAKTEDILLQR